MAQIVVDDSADNRAENHPGSDRRICEPEGHGWLNRADGTVPLIAPQTPKITK